MSRAAYPENPTHPGALPRAHLAQVARDKFNVFGPPDDYDLLSAALYLNSEPSVAQALAAGAPLDKDGGSVFNLVLREYHDHRPEENVAAGLGGTSQQGAQWLSSLLSAHPQALAAPSMGSTALRLAVQHGNISALEVLVAHGVSLDHRHPSLSNGGLLHLAAQFPAAAPVMAWALPRVPHQLDWLDYQGSSPFMDAVSMGHLERAFQLLEAGADPAAGPTSTGENVLHLAAAAESNEPLIPKVIARLPPELTRTFLGQFNHNGCLPIHEAATFTSGVDWRALAPTGDLEITTAPGKPMEEERGLEQLTPLGLAFLLGNITAARELIAAGARMDRLSATGHTGWHMLATLSSAGHEADQRHFRQCARLLLRHGVSPEQCTDDQVHPGTYSRTPQFTSFLARWRKRHLDRQVSASRPPVSPPRSNARI